MHLALAWVNSVSLEQGRLEASSGIEPEARNTSEKASEKELTRDEQNLRCGYIYEKASGTSPEKNFFVETIWDRLIY